MAKLEDVAYILDSQRVPVTKSDRKPGPYPYYGANGIQGTIDNYLFDDELVLLAEDGGNFDADDDRPIAYRVSGKCWVNNHAHVLKPKEGVDVDYLCYSLMHYDVSTIVNGATRKKLTQADMRQMEIPLPDLPTQRRIAATLDKVSEGIAVCRQMLADSDVMVNARFVEMFGDLRTNPKNWEIRTFDEITELITDGEHNTPRRVEAGIYLLSARNVLNHALQLDDVDYIDQEEYDRIAKRVIPKAGDVLISCSGTVGRCCSVPEGLKFQMVRSAALLRFKPIINPVFAEYMITSDDLQEQINSSKTASSQANLFQGKIAKLKGFVPPIELQNEFLQFARQADKSKFVVQQQLAELETLKKSLMQEYFG